MTLWPFHQAAPAGAPGVTRSPGTPERPFQFERDTFTFANELIWEYDFDPQTGRMTIRNASPPAAYSHRCFVLVRSARQFFFHARFAPDAPAAGPGDYARLIRQVVSRSPRFLSPHNLKVIIPGYDCLRAFSREHAPLLKANCGAAWQSYFVRSHWRLVGPVGRAHQEQIARQLVASIGWRGAAIVHLFRFPRITINHGIALFRAAESDPQIEFEAYDPNIPERPVKLVYERATRTFSFPPARYWRGGPLNVIEMYTGGLY